MSSQEWGTRNTSRSHRAKHGGKGKAPVVTGPDRATSSGAASSGEPPLADTTVVTGQAGTTPGIALDLFGHCLGDEFVPPAVDQRWRVKGINPHALMLVHLNRNGEPDKHCRSVPLLTSARIDDDVRMCETYRNSGVHLNALFKQKLFEAVFTDGGIESVCENHEQKMLHFDNKSSAYYSQPRNSISRSLTAIARHDAQMSCDAKGWTPLEHLVALTGRRPWTSTLAEAIMLNPKTRLQLCCVVRAPGHWASNNDPLPNGALLMWYVRAVQGHSNPRINMEEATHTLTQETWNDFPGFHQIRPLHCTDYLAAKGIVQARKMIPGGPKGKRNENHFGCFLPRVKDCPSPGAHISKPVWCFLHLRKALKEGACFGVTVNGVLLIGEPVSTDWLTIVDMQERCYFWSREPLKGNDLMAYHREQDRKNGVTLSGPINALTAEVTFTDVYGLQGISSQQASPAAVSDVVTSEMTERRLFKFSKHDNREMSVDLWHLNKYLFHVEKRRMLPAEVKLLWEELFIAPADFPDRYETFRQTDVSVTGESPTENMRERQIRLAEASAQTAREQERTRRNAVTESLCCICVCTILRNEPHWECTKCTGAIAHWACRRKMQELARSQNKAHECPVCRQREPAWSRDYATFGQAEYKKLLDDTASVLEQLIASETVTCAAKALQMEEVLAASKHIMESEDPDCEMWTSVNSIKVEVVKDLYDEWNRSFQPEKPILSELVSRHTENFPGDADANDVATSASAAPMIDLEASSRHLDTTRETKWVHFPGVRAAESPMGELYQHQPFEYYRSQYAEYHLIGGSQLKHAVNFRGSTVQFLVHFENGSIYCDSLADVVVHQTPVTEVLMANGDVLVPDPVDPRMTLGDGEFLLKNCIVCDRAVLTILCEDRIEQQKTEIPSMTAEEEKQLFSDASQGVQAYLSGFEGDLDAVVTAQVDLGTRENKELSHQNSLDQRGSVATDANAVVRAASMTAVACPKAFGRLISNMDALAQDIATDHIGFSAGNPAQQNVEALEDAANINLDALHSVVQIRSWDVCNRMQRDPTLRYSATVLDYTSVGGVTNSVPTSPLKRSIAECFGEGLEDFPFSLLGSIVVTVLQQQEIEETGLQASRPYPRCMGYFDPDNNESAWTACLAVNGWLISDPLLSEMVKGRYIDRAPVRSLEQHFLVTIVTTLDHNAKASVNLLERDGYPERDGCPTGLPFFCYWFVVCFVAVSVDAQWDRWYPSTYSESETRFMSHTMDIDTAFNVVSCMIWRAFETRMFEFIRLFGELWQQWRWLRIPGIGPDFESPLTVPPNLRKCPAERAPEDAPVPFTCSCGRIFKTGELICEVCQCDRQGVKRSSDADVSARTREEAAKRQEDQIVAFLNANPALVETLPPLDTEALMNILRHRSQGLDDLCTKMTKDQLEVLIKRFRDIPQVTTLLNIHKVMNRVIDVALMKEKQVRLCHSFRSKKPSAVVPATGITQWGWHQRACKLSSSADLMDLCIVCWHVPWTANPHIAETLSNQLANTFSFPVVILSRYLLPSHSELHKGIVQRHADAGFHFVKTDGGNALRLKVNKYAPDFVVTTLLQRPANQITGLSYEIVRVTFCTAPAVVSDDVLAQPCQFDTEAKGFYCPTCRNTWRMDNIPQLSPPSPETEGFGYCAECRDQFRLPGPYQGKCPCCEKPLQPGHLLESSLRPEDNCCSQFPLPGVLTDASVVAQEKQIEVLGKTSWTFCMFAFGEESASPNVRVETILRCRTMTRDCLEMGVDVACGPAYAVLTQNIGGRPSHFGKSTGDDPPFPHYQSILDTVVTEEVKEWNRGNRVVRSLGQTLKDGDPLTACELTHQWQERHVSVSLHTPSLRKEEDCNLLARMTGVERFSEIAAPRATAAIIFHNASSRHVAENRMTGLKVLSTYTDMSDLSPYHLQNQEVIGHLNEMELKTTDRVQISAPFQIDHYGDAAGNEPAHPEGNEGRKAMLEEVANDLFDISRVGIQS